MKLSAVSNRQIRQNNNQNQNNKQNKNVSFKGFTDASIYFWNIIDNSRAAQFTVEDMLGTNFPRTYKGAKSGYKYTGKINMPALMQEMIREFLTGPLMSATPFAVLAVATGLIGKSANTHVKNIENLSYIASTLGEQVDTKDFKEKYITSVVEDMLKQTLEKQEVDSEDVKTLTDGIIKYDSVLSNKTKGHKKQANKILTELGETFKNIIKDKKDSYIGVDFDIAKFSMGNKTNDVGATSFKNYVKYMTSYAEDYAKANKDNNITNLTKKVIDSFKTNWFGKRVMTVFSMIAITGLVMSVIPKLYTLASGDTNPDTIAFANEAQKREGK